MTASYALAALALAAVAGLAGTAGGLLPLLRRDGVRRRLPDLLALSAGYLLALALVDLLPAATAQAPSNALYVVAGYLLVFAGEFLFTRAAHSHARHTHAVADDCTDAHAMAAHPLVGGPAERETISRWAALSAFSGLAVHGLLDGVAIAARMEAGAALTLLVFVGVVLHKVPEGSSVSSLLTAAAYPRRTVLYGAFGLAGVTIAGAAVTLAWGTLSEGALHAALALATGTFLYIALTDLIPSVLVRKETRGLVAFLAGVALFLAAHALFGGGGEHTHATVSG